MSQPVKGPCDIICSKISTAYDVLFSRYRPSNMKLATDVAMVLVFINFLWAVYSGVQCKEVIVIARAGVNSGIGIGIEGNSNSNSRNWNCKGIGWKELELELELVKWNWRNWFNSFFLSSIPFTFIVISMSLLLCYSANLLSNPLDTNIDNTSNELIHYLLH